MVFSWWIKFICRFVTYNLYDLYSYHDGSPIKHKRSKSSFSVRVRQFERQFQVDGNVARNRSMDRWIGEWCSYNFAAGSFHTKKLCSRLFSREVEFYWHKQRYRVLWGLRGNVHGSSMARWKARGRLPKSADWNFSASYHGWGTMSRYWSKFRCLKGDGSVWTHISGGKGRPPPTNFGIRKLKSLGYRLVKKIAGKFQPAEQGAPTLQTNDRQTEWR